MTALPRDVKLPIAPLLDAAGATHSESCDGQKNTITRLATVCGVNWKTAQRWIVEDAIPIHAADEAAVRCGAHPANVWPEWWAACYEQDHLEDDLADRSIVRYLSRNRIQSREQAARVVEYQRVEDARARRRHLTVVA